MSGSSSKLPVTRRINAGQCPVSSGYIQAWHYELKHLTEVQKVIAGWIPVWGSEII